VAAFGIRKTLDLGPPALARRGDPMQTMAVQGDPALRPLAERVQEKLRRVIDSL